MENKIISQNHISKKVYINMIVGLLGKPHSGKTILGHKLAAMGAIHISTHEIVERLAREDKVIVKELSDLFPTAYKKLELQDFNILLNKIYDNKSSFNIFYKTVGPALLKEVEAKLFDIKEDDLVLIESDIIFETGIDVFCKQFVALCTYYTPCAIKCRDTQIYYQDETVTNRMKFADDFPRVLETLIVSMKPYHIIDLELEPADIDRRSAILFHDLTCF